MSSRFTLIVVLGLALWSVPALAQIPPPAETPAPQTPAVVDDAEVDAPSSATQLRQLTHAIVRLPLAAGLATVLALRPRRRGTPRRQIPVVQTQIILAVVGAVVMLVVGSSLARAFGIVGAAGLVRYRAKISDPKDAGVMLSTLAIGLASGVGIWMIAIFAAIFILALLWVVESFEPKAKQDFLLTVKAGDPPKLRPSLEALLSRSRLEFDLRTADEDQLSYEVRKPLERKTDRLSQLILQLDPKNIKGVEWEEKKTKT